MRRFYLFAAFVISISTQAQTIFFNNISQEDGLRNGNVRSIVKDFQGFVWIGTEDGLHRFDGSTMKVYSKVEGDSSTLGSNFILCLYEDSRKNLWVGTLDGGLFLYNRQSDSFRKYLLQSQKDGANKLTIRCLIEGKDHFLYVGTDFLFRSRVDSPKAMKFEHVPFTTDSIRRLTRFAAIENDLDSNLLVSVNSEGLFSFNLSTQESRRHPLSEIEKHISALHVDRARNMIWAGTWKSGMLIYDPSDKKWIRVKSGNDNKSLRDNFVASIVGDGSGNIWIAADKGASIVTADVDPFKDLKITTYLAGETDNGRIHGIVMKTAYVDREDKVWIGSLYEGVNIYDKNSVNFGSLSVPAAPEFGNITAIAEDANGTLWLGLDGNGLYRMDSELFTGDHKPIQYTSKVDKVKALLVSDNRLWIGSWGSGLHVVDLKGGDPQRVIPSNASIGTEVMSLSSDNGGNLWIGTFDKGLYRYRVEDGTVEKIVSPDSNPNLIDRINALLTDPQGNVWIGKDVGGLNFLKKGTSTYTPVESNHLASSTTISCIFQDATGVVWAGVPGTGVVRYDPRQRTSELFGANHGLSNLGIHAIQEDSMKRLWVSHNAGISMLDQSMNMFRNFDRRNGILASQFNNNASLMRANGVLVFGNIHGINFIDPTNYHPADQKIDIVFTRFFVDNVEQAAGSAILPENITVTSEVRLPHDKSSFSVEFASLIFSFSDDPSYSYMLEGFDKDWQPAGPRRLISYTNLQPGTYTLLVCAADNPLVTPAGTRRLIIRIIPAWWQTTWFKSLAAVLAILAAVAVHRLRIGFLLSQKTRLEKQVELRTEGLNKANHELQVRIEEIQSMNATLQSQQREIFEKNSEIQAQNEELQSQHEQIFEQQDSLLNAREQLKEINVSLERTVTERTEELKRTINDLNKTVFELDRFVYSASHDLSAPLKSIHGLVELIKLEKEHAKILEYAGYIKLTVLKLEDVIKSMIDYARNTHTLVKEEAVDLSATVEEVTQELAFWQEASRIKFINKIQTDGKVLTDKTRLKVVLHNLVSNSIKYRDPLKESNWIRFESTQNETHWQLVITDNGIGIRPEYLDKVFNMYFRATETSKGSGLGLFIVKETLRKINGTIEVHSELGQYTSFVLKIGDIAV